MRAAAALSSLLALSLTGCDPGPSRTAGQGGAPFYGPSHPAPEVEVPAPVPVPDLPITPSPAPAPAPPLAPAPTPSKPPPLAATPDRLVPDPLEGEAAHRRAAWLSEPFRCKAISTTRLRKCRFEAHAGGHRIKFPVADVVCENVEFDAHGDPARLTDCGGGWISVPRDNLLVKAKRDEIWSGSHKGWRWKDGDRYCCPGFWLAAPGSLAQAGPGNDGGKRK